MNPQSLIITLTFLILSSMAFTQNLIETKSPFTTEVSVNMLRENIQNKGLTIFTEIDHTKSAKDSGRDLPPVYLLIFGNPKVGTKLMQADPRVGIELPLKILVYDDQGTTQIAYTNPEIYGETYNLKDQEDILKNMSNLLNTIVQEVVKL